MAAEKIFLIGMMGSGKSYWAKKIAKWNKCVGYDLDDIIEMNEEKTIPEIFSEDGEDAFRKTEAKIIRWFKEKKKFVIATGGGTPCFNDNMDLINAEAISVYLDVPLGSISSRLQTSKAQQRPLFQGLDQGELTLKLKSLLVSREYFYNQAKIKLSGEDFSAELLLVELISRLKS